MASVEFRNATRIYPGAETPAVNRLNLEIEDGEFLVLIGPSGCGKSTSLRMLAGLEDVDEGQIIIDGQDVTKVPPRNRDIAMVFQNYALYPHMTVAENMGFALKIAQTPQEEIERRVHEAAEILDLTDYLDRKPKALSGGQRQRVAMGRAIVRKPQVFLMDEPLSNLDAKLRVQTRAQISTLQRRLKTTTVYVTHDQTEALTMGDRIAVLSDGVLYQVGTPDELYNRPANVFVAGFIGSPAMNLGEFRVSGKDARLGNLRIPLPADILRELEKNGEDSVVIGIRPEAFEQVCETECPGGLPLRVDMVENLGSDSYIYATAETDGEVESDSATKTASGLPSFGSGDNTHDSSRYVVLRVPPTKVVCTGSSIWAVPYPHALHFFHATNGLRIGREEEVG